MSSSRRQVATYVFFVFLFTSVFYFLILCAKTLAAGGGLYVTGIMWCPAFAASSAKRPYEGVRTRHTLVIATSLGCGHKQWGGTAGPSGPCHVRSTAVILGGIGSMA